MKRVGTLMLLDSVSSMNRDRVNFEDRMISSVRWKNKDCFIHSRSIKAKTSPHCAEMLRKKSMDYKKFSSDMDIKRAYIVLGLAEENHSIKKRWFEITINHILDEVLFLGFSPCLVSCRKKVSNNDFKKISYGRKEVYVGNGEGSWNYSLCSSLNNISRQRNIDIIRCDIECPRQWDTISVDSCKKLTYLIANDLNSFINE